MKPDAALQMKPDPIILILEDERAQILTLQAQLAGLGKLAEFMTPEPALKFARGNRCDAAIVDVRLARSTMDGLAFLRALREFDKDLAIIIRTASDSDEIADGAIELRAIKRAVKSKTTLAELRRSTEEAIKETRERREITQSAREAGVTKEKLAEALGGYDLRLAAADMHRGLVHLLRNQLTGLSALASVLKADAARSDNPDFEEHARRSGALVGNMVDSVNAFLDGPFGVGGAASRAPVNLCLGALRQFFIGVDRWTADGKSLQLRDLLSDTLVECAPLELLNGLRHLVEYFFLRSAAGSETSLIASIVHSADQMAERLAQSACVLNREAIRRDRPHVIFRVSGNLPGATVEEIRDAFAFGLNAGRTGNLHVLAGVLSAARGAVFIYRPLAGVLTVETAFPVAL
jgi:CheY-like chemotaxis protein